MGPKASVSVLVDFAMIAVVLNALLVGAETREGIEVALRGRSGDLREEE